MAITPTSDFVLDVARAADPSKLRAAEARLLSGSQDTGTSGEAQGFTQELQQLELNTINANSGTDNSMSPAFSSVTSHVSVTAPQTTGQKFEAMVLKTFVEEMLPEKADSVFGGGYAGGVWKSFLAEMVGSKMASRGGLGIAQQVDKSIKAKTESQNKQSS